MISFNPNAHIFVFLRILQRALCAESCLMTSDLLSLEQMFGSTQRRLRQLSEGAPGPVANKATKVSNKKLHMVKTDRTELDNTQTGGVFFCSYLLVPDPATV